MIKCDQRAKVRCPFKNPCCGDETAYFMEGSECDEFNQKILAPPPTNADRIRAMSDEELAKMLTIGQGGFDCSTCVETTDYRDCEQNCEEQCLKWLRQPAEEV